MQLIEAEEREGMDLSPIPELTPLVGDERLTRKMGQNMGWYAADYFISFQFSIWHFFYSLQIHI